MFDAGDQLRGARVSAGLSQRRLGTLAGTSQATIAAYEAGRKVPSVHTLARLLTHCGERLMTTRPGRVPVPSELAESDRRLQEVLELAELLPFRAAAELRHARLPGSTR